MAGRHDPLRHDPLRPHRAAGVPERWEFAIGADTICAYRLPSLDFERQIPVGRRPDCHATTQDNRWLYVACRSGLYVLSQESLEVVRVLSTGWVFGTNALPDGRRMLVHDAYGGMLVVEGVQDPERAVVARRLDVLGTNTVMDTLGGKGDFLDARRRHYLCAGWKRSRLYHVDLDTLEVEVFLEDPALELGDDLVVRADGNRAYVACYGGPAGGRLAVVDTRGRRVLGCIGTGDGSCGLTASPDGGTLYVSNDREDALSVIDTRSETLVGRLSARAGLEAAGIRGYLQGVSAGSRGEVYVYGCSGNGLLAVFRDDTVTLCWPGGKWHGSAGGAA